MVRNRWALVAATLMLALGLGGVTTAVQAATDGPAAAAGKKKKKKKKSTLPKDGTFEFTGMDGRKVTYKVSGKGTKVSGTYTFLQDDFDADDPDSCRPRTVTFPPSKFKPGLAKGFRVFQSPEIEVPAGGDDGGANGGVASFRGEWVAKSGQLNLNWKINLKNANDANTCFQYPAETAHPRKDKRK